MLYVIIERFRMGNPIPVYQRFRDSGRRMPDGITYVNSWVTTDLRRCYQVMECDQRALLDEWLANWKDLVDFEVETVMTSAEAVAELRSRSIPARFHSAGTLQERRVPALRAPSSRLRLSPCRDRSEQLLRGP